VTLDEADRNLRVALAAGDTAEIEAASAVVDDLECTQRRALPTLAASALWYAEQGIKVFPLSPGTKLPFKGSNGCKGASSNRDVVEGWWTDHPDANIGIATGHLIDVVDIDGPVGQKSRAEMWEERFAQIDADSLAKVLTPRPGGMHIYVPAQGGGNHAGICPKVDYRGVGGYCVAPPSVLIAGKCGPDDTPGAYRFLGTPSLTGLGAGAA
jgi:hypothetical protein